MFKNPTTLVLLRHGRVVGEQRLLGHTDAPLSDEGREGVRVSAKRLTDTRFDAVYSSDLCRSYETASIVALGRELEVTGIAAFRELNMGLWDGLTTKEVLEKHGERIKEWWRDPSLFRTPEGESLLDLAQRVLPALEEVLARHRGETICLVGHGGVNRVILFAAMNLSLKSYYSVSQDYACINRIRYFEDGNSVVDLVNG